jgi:hypothetical protein
MKQKLKKDKRRKPQHMFPPAKNPRHVPMASLGGFSMVASDYADSSKCRPQRDVVGANKRRERERREAMLAKREKGAFSST